MVDRRLVNVYSIVRGDTQRKKKPNSHQASFNEQNIGNEGLLWTVHELPGDAESERVEKASERTRKSDELVPEVGDLGEQFNGVESLRADQCFKLLR